MKKIKTFLPIILLSLTAVFFSALAGSFSPDPVSPGAGAYTLSDIYNKISSSTFAYSPHNFSPSTAPTSTFFSLTDIWNAISWKTLNNSGTLDAGFYATSSWDTVEPNLSTSTVRTGKNILGMAGSCTSVAEPFYTGLVAYWPFDSDWTDYSGQNCSTGDCEAVACNSWDAQMNRTTCERIGCTWSGSCIGTTNLCPTQTMGIIGGAYDYSEPMMDQIFFDTTDMPMGNSARTLSVWVYPYDLNTRYYVFGYGVDYGREFRIALNEWTQVAIDACYAVWGAQDSVININAWNHIVVVYSGSGSPQFYVNGAHYTTVVNYGSPSVNTDSGGGTIGARGAGCGWWDPAPMNGKIDEAAIWSRALSEVEILKLYNNGAGRSLLIPD